jgi:hypothetical protein
MSAATRERLGAAADRLCKESEVLQARTGILEQAGW